MSLPLLILFNLSRRIIEIMIHSSCENAEILCPLWSQNKNQITMQQMVNKKSRNGLRKPSTPTPSNLYGSLVNRWVAGIFMDCGLLCQQIGEKLSRDLNKMSKLGGERINPYPRVFENRWRNNGVFHNDLWIPGVRSDCKWKNLTLETFLLPKQCCSLW